MTPSWFWRVKRSRFGGLELLETINLMSVLIFTSAAWKSINFTQYSAVIRRREPALRFSVYESVIKRCGVFTNAPECRKLPQKGSAFKRTNFFQSINDRKQFLWWMKKGRRQRSQWFLTAANGASTEPFNRVLSSRIINFHLDSFHGTALTSVQSWSGVINIYSRSVYVLFENETSQIVSAHIDWGFVDFQRILQKQIVGKTFSFINKRTFFISVFIWISSELWEGRWFSDGTLEIKIIHKCVLTDIDS